MSDKHTDAFTQLGHAVLDARHNGTSPGLAEAARLTLLGKLPPLPPNVEVILKTDFVEVPMVAVSQGGKIAYLGIARDGHKEILEWNVKSQMGCFIRFTNSEYHIAHLHYPHKSEDAAFTVVEPSGKTYVYWGDGGFKATDSASNKVVGIFGFRDKNDRRHCVVVCTRMETQFAVLFTEATPLSDLGRREIASGQYLKVLGVFGDRIAVHVTERGKKAILLVGSPSEETWASEWYDQIIEDSAMIRDSGFSFVGFNEVYPRQDGVRSLLAGTGDLFIAGRGSKEKITGCVLPGNVHCLPSGRILIHGYGKDIFLLEVGTNDPINIPGAKGIRHILEIEAGLVVHAITHSDLHVLLVVHWNMDSVPGAFKILTHVEVSDLCCWGEHLVFKAGDRLGVICVANLENRLVESDNDAYTAPIDSYPLYTPFECLVSTDVGILSWHFVNGTLYIIRYPL